MFIYIFGHRKNVFGIYTVKIVCAYILWCVHTDRDRDRDRETDKMGLKPNDIGLCICLGQYEHLHTVPYDSFLICLSDGLCPYEHTLKQGIMHFPHDLTWSIFTTRQWNDEGNVSSCVCLSVCLQRGSPCNHHLGLFKFIQLVIRCTGSQPPPKIHIQTCSLYCPDCCQAAVGIWLKFLLVNINITRVCLSLRLCINGLSLTTKQT